MNSDTRDYIEAQVRRHDRDRYLTSLFAPAARRPHLWALYAFNIELAHVRETVSEPMMGEIRLQWWRDAVAAMVQGAGVPHQPVAESLAELVRGGLLAPEYLERLIDARLPELYDEVPPDMTAFEARVAATDGALAYAAAVLLGGNGPENDAAGAAGTAWGLARVLKDSPRYAAMNRVQLPEDRMAALGVAQKDLMAAQGSPGQKALMAEIAVWLRQHFDKARAGHAKPVRSPVLLATLAASDLKALEAAQFDPATDITAHPGAGRLARLYWAGMTGRI